MKSGIVITQPSMQKAMEFLTWHDVAPYRYWVGSKRGKQEGLSAVSLEIQFVGQNPKPVSETEGKLRARVASLSMPNSTNIQVLNSTVVRQIPWGDLIASHSSILAENLRTNNLKSQFFTSKMGFAVKHSFFQSEGNRCLVLENVERNGLLVGIAQTKLLQKKVVFQREIQPCNSQSVWK